LTNIPARNSKFARRALQLLAFDHDINFLTELAEGVIIDGEQCSFDINDRFLYPEDILEICTCLIAYNENEYPQVQLAHYSVKEYLVSERMRAVTFRISDRGNNIFMATTCLTYLLGIAYESLPELQDNNTKSPFLGGCHFLGCCEDLHPFIKVAATCWNEYAGKVETEEVVSHLILKLLNPCEPHFNKWLEHMEAWQWETCNYHFPNWAFNPGAELTATLAYTCYFGLVSTAETLLDLHSDLSILGNLLELRPSQFVYGSESGGSFSEWAIGTPLHIAAALGKVDFVELLIERGANANAIVGNGFTVLHSAVEYYEESPDSNKLDILQLLLKAGVDVNPRFVGETPLQAAVRKGYEYYFALVRVLLEAGADVNAVGDDEAVVKGFKYDHRNEVDQNLISKIVYERGKARNYDTPLRLAKTIRYTKNATDYRYKTEESMRTDLKKLLKSYGAKSLHLFPVKDLPGYVEADIEAFLKDSEDEEETGAESNEA
jgi:hypothetical protein